MGDKRRRHEGRAHEVAGREERAGLLDLLRRLIGARQPSVLVMDRDGQIRRVALRSER